MSVAAPSVSYVKRGLAACRWRAPQRGARQRARNRRDDRKADQPASGSRRSSRRANHKGLRQQHMAVNHDHRPLERHPHYPHLFSPIAIKGVTLKNRVAISGHFAGWWVDGEGLPSDAFHAYVEERAKGGVGLFVIGATGTRYDATPPFQ